MAKKCPRKRSKPTTTTKSSEKNCQKQGGMKFTLKIRTAIFEGKTIKWDISSGKANRKLNISIGNCNSFKKPSTKKPTPTRTMLTN